MHTNRGIPNIDTSLSDNFLHLNRILHIVESSQLTTSPSMQGRKNINNFQIFSHGELTLNNQSTIQMFASLNSQVNSFRFQNFKNRFHNSLANFTARGFSDYPTSDLTGRQSQDKDSSSPNSGTFNNIFYKHTCLLF